jgi:hypothetical protein
MNIELIDLSKYKDFSKLKPFIDSFKDFDINKAIQFLEDKNVKDTTDMDAEYWHHAVGTDSGTTYTSNWHMGKEDEEYLDDPDDFKGVWQYIKFYSPGEYIPDFLTEYFQKHLDVYEVNYEVELHSLAGGARIEDHVDKPGVPVGESSNRNLVISLQYPKGLPPDTIGVHVDNKAFTPEAAPIFMFDSQYLHGAWNNSKEPWVFAVIYIPSNKIDL